VSRTNDNCFAAVTAYPTFIAEHPASTPCQLEPDTFTGYGDRQGTRRRREERAAALCQSCALRQQCLDWAVATHQIGVWGGTTAFQRTNIRKRASRVA